MFGIGYGEENEEFTKCWLKIKSSGKQKEYSEPLIVSKSRLEVIKSPSNKIDKLIEGDEGTRLWRGFGLYNQDDDLVGPISIIKGKHKNFKWSVTDIDNVRYLEIKGQKPDEIIPFILDGHDFYFYYYLDLDLDEGYDRKDFKIKK